MQDLKLWQLKKITTNDGVNSKVELTDNQTHVAQTTATTSRKKKKSIRNTGRMFAPNFSRIEFYQIFNSFIERSENHRLVAETIFLMENGVCTKSGKVNKVQLGKETLLDQSTIDNIMEEFCRAFEEFG